MTVRTLFLGALAGLAAAAAEAADKPLVVELFTSQGCNSCPPADRHLTTLAARPDLIALSLHVDYWDYLGWRDSFGSPAHGRRQRAYQAGLGGRSIYTPQLVIGGAAQAVGSDQGAVAKAIAAAPRPVLDLAVEGERL
ncbi:MAG: DUF1223 domain-containing protein, partial [Alphaproteobacteria bacterium]|nr:DUF1223 domain-containing protein [Alphaproteobacteria bacterium]